MNKLFLFAICIATLITGCTEPQTNNYSETTSMDSLVSQVMRALVDTNTCVFDYKDEFNVLLDTMAYHAQYHPNENIRIGAKSYAMLLSALCMDKESNLSSDKIQFFLDSMVLRLTHIQNVWYYDSPDDSKDYPVLSQNVLKMEDDGKNHITSIEVRFCPSGNVVTVTYPFDAVSQPMIHFAGEDVTDIDTACVFDESNATSFEERSESGYLTITFDQSLIDAMLSHQAMYIGYLSDDETKVPIERFRSSMLLLWDFQKQYPEIAIQRNPLGV